MTLRISSDTLAETAHRCETDLVGWRITRMREALAGAPLVVVATGSTHSAALLWARLHEETGHAAWASTPHDFVARALPPGTRVLLLSGSGRHHDMLRAARHAVRCAPAVHAAVCTHRPPLGDLLRDAGDQNGVIQLTGPDAGLDGFLPLRALVPMIVLAARVRGTPGLLAPVFGTARPASVPPTPPRDVVVLGAGLATPAAADFAIKVRESGLAPASYADPRDFAHGAWRAADPERTWLVSFALPEQRPYLDAMLADLPLPTVRIQTRRAGVEGALELLARGALTLARAIEHHGAEPHRAKIPAWATRLYHRAED